ncbi:sigma-54-dependent transcriptional regulator [Vannielia litorea]|uniref:DNA-binding transcriptional response regulator, NtrC family, contains REC, AAA-type ATPase, and a Fis-type DNA-binding domains n=1 Tax=Vannielia litorea TaxID=1217970 RepID=A0A1N6E0L9_9RHOB|nr:response regulator [Vannielia litorea]SIN76542.1 DNA-binding transcriptional response regulator, NtrC family, contains REC, AAA-type ATPase, and a Fis-type DNA-binding domains [Vannielia litorea]
MLTGRHVVLIEDDPIMGHSLLQRLELEGADVTWVRQATRGVAAVRTPRRPVDAVICDIRLPDGSGEDIFNTVTGSITPPPFLFITGQGEIDQAVRLLRAGAADYMTKPFELAAFLDRLALILRPDTPQSLPPQVGVSALARQVERQVAEAGASDAPVLIRGERGLGKALLAERIHGLSDRRAAPYITVNALRDEAPDAALKKAMSDVGEGTIFLSGVGRLAPESQDLLLDWLERAPFRLIATSGTRIGEKVEAGGFRGDLHFALIANEIVVPSLAQRPEDTVWLAGQFFQTMNARRETPLRGISDLALSAMRDHDWPGNGRELRARMQRALRAAEGAWIFPADVFPELTEHGAEVKTLSQARENAERRQIIKVLDQTGGQVSEAARVLKVSRTTLWEKMQKLGI